MTNITSQQQNGEVTLLTEEERTPRQMPHTEGFDSTLALLREGYLFITNRCHQYQSAAFETRFLLQKTICLRGAEAAELFYDTERFMRAGAMPNRIKQTLFGYGGVQGLDDGAHEHRKTMLMSLMQPAHIEELVEQMQATWRNALVTWEAQDQVVFFEEIRRVIFRAVCAWSGVPLAEEEIATRADQITARIDSSAAIGPRQWGAQWARIQTERWLEPLIVQVRQGNLNPPAESALYVLSHHRDLNGDLLDSKVATVELLNIIRPTVAVGRFIAYAALALHEHPTCQEQLRKYFERGQNTYDEWFVQEVRRFYPFFPFVAARVRRDFQWKGYHFPEGCRVLLDLYGTNRDASRWSNPNLFLPERFCEHEITPFDLIPQGGGDYIANHRCAGEWITLALMKGALHMLVSEMAYDVPKQDLSVSLTDFPSQPRSGLIMTNVRPSIRANRHQHAG